VECDDQVACTVDSCNEGTDSCDNVPDDRACDNGLYCDGAETCDAENDCQPGTAPCPDDGQFCNGAESCDESSNQCLSSGNPCPDETICDESTETCVGCLVDDDCDDGVGCTDDSCDEVNDTCVNSPNDANCDDGQWCNGSETCHSALDCQAGTAPVCDDGIDCTHDSCDEEIGDCVFSCNAAGPDDPCCQDAACSDTPVCTPTRSIPTFNTIGIIALLSMFVTAGFLASLRRSRSV
jgi:hypothetical protein